MRQQGVRVTLISSPGEQLCEFAGQEGADWETVRMQRAITPLADLASVRDLSRKLRHLKPDIVHAHTPKAGLLAMLASKHAGVPRSIYHLHGLRFETASGSRRLLLKQVERLTCGLADRVLCVSRSLREKAISESILDARKSEVLCQGSINGLDVDQFDSGRPRAELRQATRKRLGIPQDAICLGFVGRMVRDKGVEELYAAWTKLRARYRKLHLLLVGPFESEDPIDAAIRQRIEQDPRIHLTGLDWNTRPYFCAMDLFTLPSHREGLGHVLLEAAAMGLAAVSCRVTGCVDAVDDGVTGTLVAVKNPSALAAAIERYLTDDGLRWQHGQRARLRVCEQFQPIEIWQAQYDEYCRLMQSTSGL